MGRKYIYIPARVAYATWNPSDKSPDITLSGSNLTATSRAASPTASVRATVIMTDHTMYEATVVSRANTVIGIANSSAALNQYTGQNVNSWGYYCFATSVNGGAGVFHTAAATNSGMPDYVVTNVIGCTYVSTGGGTIQFYRGGVAVGTTVTGVGAAVFPAFGTGGGIDAVTANFGATAFAFPVSGFSGVH